MVTPDFEDWLRRQDFDVTDTVTVDAYINNLDVNLGLSGGSLDVAKDIYSEKYDVFPQLGITPFNLQGQVRYGIKGYPGAWGRKNALIYGQDIAEQKGLVDQYEILARWYEEEFGGD